MSILRDFMEERIGRGDDVTPELKEMVKDESKTATKFSCRCGKQESWIAIGDVSEPCPNCGRQYIGRYDRKNLGVTAIIVGTIDGNPTTLQNNLRKFRDCILGTKRRRSRK